MSLKLELLPNIFKLCYYNRIFRFLYLNRKTIFSKTFSYFLHLISAFTKIFVFNDGHIIDCEKKSSRGDEFPMELHCFQKHLLSTNFYENRKFFHGKRTWKTLG